MKKENYIHFSTRLPKSLHRFLMGEAVRRHMSKNQLIIQLVTELRSQKEAEKEIA